MSYRVMEPELRERHLSESIDSGTLGRFGRREPKVEVQPLIKKKHWSKLLV